MGNRDADDDGENRQNNENNDENTTFPFTYFWLTNKQIYIYGHTFLLINKQIYICLHFLTGKQANDRQANLLIKLLFLEPLHEHIILTGQVVVQHAILLLASIVNNFTSCKFIISFSISRQF